MELVAVAFALLVGAVLLARACRRSLEDGPRFAEVLDLVAWLLDRPERVAGKRLEDLRQAEVEATVRAVYLAQVAGTDLEGSVVAGAFVGTVVTTWRELAGVSLVVGEGVRRANEWQVLQVDSAEIGSEHMETFLDWLREEIQRRKWSNSQLAEEMDFSAAAVSYVLAGKRGVTFEFCRGVAQAFHLAPEAVMRQAGLLDPLPDEVEDEREAVRLFRRLDATLRRAMLATMRHLAGLAPVTFRNGSGPCEGDSSAGRQAAMLAEEMRYLSEEDQSRVLDLMHRLRGREDRGQAEGHGEVVPLDAP